MSPTMGVRRSAVGWILLWVVSTASGVWAVDPSLEVSLEPKTFGLEDTALIEVRVLEPSGSPIVDLGGLENLEVVGGPSETTEFSWVNGAATRSVKYTYVVQANEVGQASIGPVTVRLGDVELRSEELRAEVVPGSVAPPRSRGRRSPFPMDPFEDFVQRRQPSRSIHVELRQLLDRDSAVLGQPVVTRVVLDTTSGGIDGFEWIDPPSYPGWWAQRVEPPERITSEVVEVDGVRYNRFVVARHVLVPLKTGEVTIPEIGARIGFRSASLFGPQQVVERRAAARTVVIAPRPRAPEGFSGAVGDLRYRASLQPESIEFGESTVLSIELRGSGNLPLVESPALWPECADCESYPPEQESSFTVDERGIRGSRVWRTTLVPRSWGTLDLAPVTLAVFDPASGRYSRQTLGPFELVVEAPPATPTPVVDQAELAGEKPVDEGLSGEGAEGPRRQVSPQWLRTLGVLVLGLVVGGAVAFFVARRRRVALPPRRPGESPAERARTLQVALERWWLDARAKVKGEALEEEMRQLRKDLEAVRFAPGRADHSETVAELEERVKGLMRRA